MPETKFEETIYPDAVMADRNARAKAAIRTPKALPYRQEVHHFAQAMEHKLRRNDHKGGWSDLDTEELFRRLRAEVDELEKAIAEGNVFEITMEASDVANYAMMLCDNNTGGSLK